MKISKLQIKNYRSIEKLTLEFDDYYTALCGKNNSGKSNIIRVILQFLSRVRINERLNFTYDYPIWKRKNATKEIIVLSIVIQLFKESDTGLIKFLNVFGSSKNDSIIENGEIKDTELELIFNISQKLKDNTPEVLINGNKVSDKYRISEIFRRIQASQLIIFHNSTQVERRYRNPNHGYLENLSSTTKSNIESKIKSIKKELSKVVEKHKKVLQSLIGRLEDKYSVSLSFSEFDLDIDQIPYEIFLGERSYELPLEDWGSGTKNRTLILTSIFNAKKQIDNEDDSARITPVVIIEEPESFLHPSAQAEFGRVLQDLSKELKIQVIATTHSPYLLSHNCPNSNILLKRRIFRGKIKDTFVESFNEENWKEPFELALGMVGPEFDSLKNAFFSSENSILFVEGEIDKEYFNLLRDEKHGTNRLNYQGDIYSYDGFGFLTNNILLKFIKNKFSKIYITLDLDAYDTVKINLERADLIKDKDYFIIGKDKPGKRNIEGLLPDSIKNIVNALNPDIVQALFSDDKREVKSARSKLKSLYLDKFKESAKPGEDYYEFYEVSKRINKAISK